MTRRRVKSSKKHNISHHINEIVIVEISVLNEPAYTPTFIHIHGDKCCIDASILNNLLHDGLTTTFYQNLRAKTRRR